MCTILKTQLGHLLLQDIHVPLFPHNTIKVQALKWITIAINIDRFILERHNPYTMIIVWIPPNSKPPLQTNAHTLVKPVFAETEARQPLVWNSVSFHCRIVTTRERFWRPPADPVVECVPIYTLIIPASNVAHKQQRTRCLCWKPARSRWHHKKGSGSRDGCGRAGDSDRIRHGNCWMKLMHLSRLMCVGKHCNIGWMEGCD